jgi:hypothetical protein
MKTRKTVIGLALLSIVVWSTAGYAANGVEVNTDAALTGTYGLEVTADGSDSNASYVATNSPSAETGVKVSFNLDPNSLTPLDMDGGKNIRIMQALSTFPKPPNASSVQHIIVFIKRNFADDNYRIRVMAQQNFGFFATCSEFFFVVDGGPAKNVSIEWVQGQGAQGSQDGRCSVYVDDVLKGQKTNLNTSEFNINELRFGVFQPDASATGSYYLDDVVVTRIP